MEVLSPKRFEARAQRYKEMGYKVRVKDDILYCGKFPVAKKDTLPCTRNDTASDFNGVYKAKQRIAQKYGVSVNKVIPTSRLSDAIYLHRANNREAVVKECALFVNGVPEAIIDYGAKENWPISYTGTISFPNISDINMEAVMLALAIWFLGALFVAFIVTPIFYFLGGFALSILGLIIDGIMGYTHFYFNEPTWGEVVIWDHPNLWIGIFVTLWTILCISMCWDGICTLFKNKK